MQKLMSIESFSVVTVVDEERKRKKKKEKRKNLSQLRQFGQSVPSLAEVNKLRGK